MFELEMDFVCCQLQFVEYYIYLKIGLFVNKINRERNKFGF